MIIIDGTHDYLFIHAVWWVWRWRNNHVLGENSWNLHYVLRNVFNSRKEYNAAMDSGTNITADIRCISWSFPPQNYIKINVDGSLSNSQNFGGFGGLLRDENGVWLQGFIGRKKVHDILHLELLAIFHGIRIAWDSGFRAVVCESDSADSIRLIKDEVACNYHRYGALVNDIRHLLNREWRVQIQHVLREGNQCADVLAKMGTSQDQDFVFLGDAPSSLSLPLFWDRFNTEFPRGF